MVRAHRNKKSNGLRVYGQDTEWSCQKGEEVVDTLQAAKCMARIQSGLVKKVRKLSIRCKLQSLLAVSVTVRENRFENLGMQSK